VQSLEVLDQRMRNRATAAEMAEAESIVAVHEDARMT
jgi:hypothetical protein